MKEKNMKIFRETLGKYATRLKQNLTADDILWYWETLEDETQEDIELALKLLMKDVSYLPFPAVIISKIRVMKRERDIQELPKVCGKCGKADGYMVPGENICQQCYGVVTPPPEYFQKIYKLLDKISKPWPE